MTEGVPALVDVEDVKSRRPLTTEEEATATIRVDDAVALLRTLIPDIDMRVAADTTGALGHLVKTRVADVVIRYLNNPMGAKSLQQTIGPRSLGVTFDGQPTGIFFTDDELAALRPNPTISGGEAIGTAFLGIRPGWAPSPHRARGGFWC